MIIFAQYRHKTTGDHIEMRPYLAGEALADDVEVDASAKKAGHPKAGDMIARDVAEPEDGDQYGGRPGQWLVTAKELADYVLTQGTPDQIFPKKAT